MAQPHLSTSLSGSLGQGRYQTAREARKCSPAGCLRGRQGRLVSVPSPELEAAWAEMLRWRCRPISLRFPIRAGLACYQSLEAHDSSLERPHPRISLRLPGSLLPRAKWCQPPLFLKGCREVGRLGSFPERPYSLPQASRISFQGEAGASLPRVTCHLTPPQGWALNKTALEGGPAPQFTHTHTLTHTHKCAHAHTHLRTSYSRHLLLWLTSICLGDPKVCLEDPPPTTDTDCSTYSAPPPTRMWTWGLKCGQLDTPSWDFHSIG